MDDNTEVVLRHVRTEGDDQSNGRRFLHVDGGSIPRPKSLNSYQTIQSSLRPPVINNPRPATLMESITQDVRQDNVQPLYRLECRKLNTELLDAVEGQNTEKVKRLLSNSANPNATCRLGHISACHIAALNGGAALSLLLEAGAQRNRVDKLGRTPLHIAAWAGNVGQVALLLDLPEDLQLKVKNAPMSLEAEEEVKKLRPLTTSTTNVECNIGIITVLPVTWSDSMAHSCRDINEHIPLFKPMWTPLHAAASCTRVHCIRLLLAAGANPNARDLVGNTPLEVTGMAYYYGKDVNSDDFTETVRLLIQAGSRNTNQIEGLNPRPPLHTAVELECLGAMKLLLDSGAPVEQLDEDGRTPIHICVKNKLKDYLQVLASFTSRSIPQFNMNVKDGDGCNVLQASIRVGWLPGVCIALEAGADITSMAKDGETPLHDAAILGNAIILNELLHIAKCRGAVDCRNGKLQTALFVAISHNQIESVKKLIQEGASPSNILPGNINVLHAAAEVGSVKILNLLMDSDKVDTDEMINEITKKYKLTPLNLAVLNNHVECVKFLLTKNANVHVGSEIKNNRSPTALHQAAKHDYLDIAKIIIDHDKSTIDTMNPIQWSPLHVASFYASRNVIKLLLKEGADLAKYADFTKKESAINVIMTNLSKPTEFMEDIFDSSIQCNVQKFGDPYRVIDINYNILIPNALDEDQMKVIHALKHTGNRYDQQRLLIHPLIESFLHLKWKALLPFFYAIITLYSTFVVSLTTMIMSITYTDVAEVPPAWMNINIWKSVVYAMVVLISIQEILYAINISRKAYFLSIETWVKLSSLLLAVVLTGMLNGHKSEFNRQLATAALLISWTEMMFLLSRFPSWGYYFLMFVEVASKIIKILCSFMFLLIGFSLGFMLQFHAQEPFEDIWTAIAKTLVMMTSEFDYDDMFEGKFSKDLATVMLRIIFIIFVIMAAIVLVNLMVGVAVNDLHKLELIGNIKRVQKQVDLLDSLESLVYNTIFNRILPRNFNRTLQNKRKVPRQITLRLGDPLWKTTLPSHITDAIFDKALTNKKRMEEQIDSQSFRAIIDEIYKATVLKHNGKEQSNDMLNRNIVTLMDCCVMPIKIRETK